MFLQKLTPSLLAASLALAGAMPTLAAEQTVRVNPNDRYQSIEGFGTCLISWVDEFAQLYRTPAFQKTYTQDMGMNMLRVNVWGPTMPEPVENAEAISYKNFQLDGDGKRAQVFIDFAKGIKKLNPDAKIIGTVWSPPAWMKEIGSITDEKSGAIQGGSYVREGREFTNRVKKEYYPHFVNWLVEMVKLHDAAGVPFYAISPGNEVAFTQTFESCVWTAEDYATIVAMLGEELEKEGYGHVKIFGPETMTGHNWSVANPMYIQALRENPKAWEHFDIFATHGYADGFTADTSKNSSAEFWDLINEYDRPYWMTEGGTGDHDWPAPLGKNGVGPAMHNAFVAGHASAFVPWQIVERKKSHHALMTLDGMTKKSHVVRHYTTFIDPGAVRVGAEPAYGDVSASAYLHEENGELTLVLLNPTQETQDVTVELDESSGLSQMNVYRTSASENLKELEPATVENGRVQVNMPAQSVVTLHGTARNATASAGAQTP